MRGWSVRAAFLVFAVAYVATGLVASALYLAAGDFGDESELAVYAAFEVISFAALLAIGGRALTRHRLGLRETAPRLAAGLAVLAFLATYVVAVYWTALVGSPETSWDSVIDDVSPGVAAGWAVLMIAIGPLFEELFFRGYLFGTLRERTGVFAAAALASIPFALIHFAYGAALLPDYWFFGFAMCLLYERTGSLWPGLAVHAATNAMYFEWIRSESVGLTFSVIVSALLVLLVMPSTPWWPGKLRARERA